MLKALGWRYWVSFIFGFATFTAQASIYPYKVSDGQIVYQRYANKPKLAVKGATQQDFKVVFKNNFMAIATSQGHFYCNDRALDSHFSPSTARILDGFLLTNVGAFASCQPTVAIDHETFSKLNFPFYKNANQILLASGKVLAGADANSFHSARSQGYDAHHYFFVAGNKPLIVNYQQSVHLYNKCLGWAKVDSQLYFKGHAQSSVDASSFKCLSRYVVADKDHLIIDGAAKLTFKAQLDTNALHVLKGNFISDGKTAWFASVAPFEFKGLDVSQAKVSGMTISDGKQSWKCQNFQQDDQPMCEKVKL